MISAHWEEAEFTLQSHPAPPMIYDYGGFPDYTYSIRYDAPGLARGLQVSIAALAALLIWMGAAIYRTSHAA